jgi:hypothetical protein
MITSFFSPSVTQPLLQASALGGPDFSRRFTGEMKGRNTLFLQSDLLAFVGIPVTAKIFRNYSVWRQRVLLIRES